MVVAGILWGLALLTKIHAWFLPPLALGWILTQVKIKKSIPAFLIWIATGFLVFLVGWPWLWADPRGRLAAYLGTGVNRISIRVLYFGNIFADREVPWHYPWVYFAVTVPVGLLALGVWGTLRGWNDAGLRATTRLCVASILLFLILFSTRVAVYDGERLFLVVFPALAILAGHGFAAIWESSRRGWVRGLLVLGLLLQGVGVVWFHPFGLSYYNVLVGGLPGAERLGLELTYWGDSIDGILLDRLADEVRPEQSVALAPTLAPDQGKIATTTRRLARIPVIIGDGDRAGHSDWLLVARRSAYWSDEVWQRLERDERVMVRSRQGVWLAVLLRRAKTNHPLVASARIPIMVSDYIES